MAQCFVASGNFRSKAVRRPKYHQSCRIKFSRHIRKFELNGLKFIQLLAKLSAVRSIG